MQIHVQSVSKSSVINSYSVASDDVVRVRMPFSPEAPSSAPYWFHDNTTGAVTGLYKDLLDAVFTAANLTYSLGGFSKNRGYTDLGEELILPGTHLPHFNTIRYEHQWISWRGESLTS